MEHIKDFLIFINHPLRAKAGKGFEEKYDRLFAKAMGESDKLDNSKGPKIDENMSRDELLKVAKEQAEMIRIIQKDRDKLKSVFSTIQRVIQQ